MAQYDFIRKQLMQGMAQLKTVRMSEAPNYVTMLQLKRTLEADGMASALAEKIVARMKIEVNGQVAADKELMQEICETYSTLIMQMHNQIQIDFDSNADELILDMVQQLKMELNF